MYSTGYWGGIYLDCGREILVRTYSKHCTTRVTTGLSCALMYMEHMCNKEGDLDKNPLHAILKLMCGGHDKNEYCVGCNGGW
jgi:hypothetical protein